MRLRRIARELRAVKEELSAKGRAEARAAEVRRFQRTGSGSVAAAEAAAQGARDKMVARRHGSLADQAERYRRTGRIGR